MSTDNISVICLEESSLQDNSQEKGKKVDRYVLIKVFGMSFGIISFCILFASFWAIIPRTDSIIYQSYWIEAVLPTTSIYVLYAASDLLNLSTWTEEKSLFSPSIFLKMFFMYMIPNIFFYISSYVTWSVYLEYNHPMPNLGLIIWPIFITFTIGLWFILPSTLLSQTEFRRKLKIYMLYKFWVQIVGILMEIFKHLFANPPLGLQFLVPFMVAGFRELDTYLRSRLITKMMGITNESATSLNSIHVSSLYTVFIAIRIVGTKFTTILCSIAVDFFLHLKTAYKIVKESTRIEAERIWNENPQNERIKTLVIGELIEGFTPIIYAICMMMAYYGPNANILSNVGNTYLSEKIEDIGLHFITMAILFAVDTLNVAISSFYLWNTAKINMLREVYQILGEFWHFIAIKLAFYMTTFFASNDINLGLDGTHSFQWISQEGWISLVNDSIAITDDEKASLVEKISSI